MIKKSVQMKLVLGLHARPSSYIVTHIIPLKLDQAELSFNGKMADLKSILSLLSLFVPVGSFVDVILSGPDEEAALKIIEDVFSNDDIESILNRST